jgi:hypothetical protein
MRRLITILTVLGAVLVGTAGVALATPPAPAFYVDGQAYATVGTPSDFTHTGAPAHSYDTIYAIAEQMNVADAKPGDRDFNGGRWMVQEVVFSDYDGALADVAVNPHGDDHLGSDEQVLAAVAGGYAELGGILASFECPVIPLRGHNA